MEEDEPISLPTLAPILMKHKVKTRNILPQDYEIQYSIKQGTNWLNMAENYRSTRKGFVKRTCESIEMTPHSADNHKNNKMQPNLVQKIPAYYELRLNPNVLSNVFIFNVCYFYFSEGVIVGSPPIPQQDL